jgi:hypothetical protein
MSEIADQLTRFSHPPAERLCTPACGASTEYELRGVSFLE